MKIPFDKPIPWDWPRYPVNPPEFYNEECGCGECHDCWYESLKDHPDYPDGPIDA